MFTRLGRLSSRSTPPDSLPRSLDHFGPEKRRSSPYAGQIQRPFAPCVRSCYIGMHGSVPLTSERLSTSNGTNTVVKGANSHLRRASSTTILLHKRSFFDYAEQQSPRLLPVPVIGDEQSGTLCCLCDCSERPFDPNLQGKPLLLTLV